ncbi:dTDP-4-amino-4,6-dideoxygalactose transaminase [Pseudobutyrivibrio sp. YE44]|uniref:DegT/DnrJ/EryC1/StrS family aminotransferase n=1 Tax=Pseudobutyrivibrio sp. YE44 TaxID=1520802 RepID=UPI000880FAC2|nr:DegT/DnrJ/EryC1/StrS family aminotransferase [Pseudobutyrivibrio sp. YE44]SDB56182.1 dTDP-4-amino-4,6-dideoxygalactose transaminase [Pseudobutyrivibrio sp. YE44]
MIPVMNVQRQYASLQEELDTAALEVLHSGGYILGPKVADFEKQFAEYCGAKYAVGVGNGTDALVIALLAAGIGEGDEVITTAMTFVSTAEAIAQVGATPVFVDITPDTFTMDPSKLEAAFTAKTKAVIPVHIYGQAADMDAINEIAHAHGAITIEDCAQAAGAKYKGKRTCSLGDIACVSFFPTKNLGAAGDAGIIVTSNEDLYKGCMAYRVHGSGLNGAYTYARLNGQEFDESKIDFHGNLPKYYNYLVGFNSRLDALQAAMLSVKLPHLDDWNARRREIAAIYNEKITNDKLTKPVVAEGNEHIFYVYPMKVQDRAKFRAYMEEKGITTGVYFPVPMHEQACFGKLGYKHGDFPVAEDLAEHGVTIPMFPELTAEEIQQVIDAVNSF